MTDHRQDHRGNRGQTPLLGGPNFIDLSAIYDAQLRATFLSEARRQGVGVVAHHVQRQAERRDLIEHRRDRRDDGLHGARTEPSRRGTGRGRQARR